jgi:HAD superfamily hydrolase (TIGR01662 family)
MKLVILDRDGTINVDSNDYIKSPEEWQPIKGSLEAIARLIQADYRVVVATNQSGMAADCSTPRRCCDSTSCSARSPGSGADRRLLLLSAQGR